MTRRNYLNVRLDDDLTARIDRLTTETTGNRSEVVRSLLWQALGSPADLAATRQALFDYGQIRKLITRRLGQEISERLPGIVDEILEAQV